MANNIVQTMPPIHLVLVISVLRCPQTKKVGGAERVLTNLANHWAELGYKVSIITLFSAEIPTFYPLHPSITIIPCQQKLQEQKTNVKNVVYHFGFLKKIFRKLKLSEYSNMILKYPELRKTLKQLKPNLVVSFIDLINIPVLCAMKGLSIPTVISERSDPAFSAMQLKKIKFMIYNWATILVVQTQAIANFFPKYLQAKIKIIPNYFNMPLVMRWRPKPTLQTIISVGRLDKEKDQTTLIKAFAKISLINPKLQLLIYGEGSERPDLEQLIHDLNMQDKIILKGVTDKVYQALIEADLFVLPSIYEGIPNALGEAMSVGLPVICSNYVGNLSLVREGIDGRVFPVGDAEVLSQLLQELVDDPAQCSRLGLAATEVNKRFERESILLKWDAVIDSCLKQGA